MTNDNSTSLNKFISSTGLCSRREADTWIDTGRVKINGKIAQKGNRVEEEDKIFIDGKLLKAKPKLIYIALNKPYGITSTTDLKDSTNIIEFVNHPNRVFPIGRLDKPSTGLILLTNDGDIVNKILRAENNHEKEYIVSVNKPLTKTFLRKMQKGVPILDTVTKRCKTKQISEATFKIVLTQGLNRQIRRMCEYFDYEVTMLKRVRIMNINVNDLPVGKWRDLTEQELDVLKENLE
ncbi:MAG: 23S rRNA pseudouridine2604 synthase [Cognaticolwellia sp.]|jgi:23S rRNA pseudouridine2604 synthase